MSRACYGQWVSLLVMAGLIGGQLHPTTKSPRVSDSQPPDRADSFLGSKARSPASSSAGARPAGS